MNRNETIENILGRLSKPYIYIIVLCAISYQLIIQKFISVRYVMNLYEILVPTMMSDKPVRTRHHKEWDRQILLITNGATILTPTKGKWVSPDKELFFERMIPVRIVCTREEIEKVIDITLKHYNQIAVLAYKISDEVILKYR